MPLVLPRRSLSLDFVRDGQASGDNYPTELSKLDGLLTFARASTATRFNASGLLETVASGQPRFDFDPATLQCRGLLIEEARTNNCLQSANFGTTWFLSGGITRTAAADSGWGINLDRLVAVNASGSDSYSQTLTGLSTSGPNTISAYVKKHAGTAISRIAIYSATAGAFLGRLSIDWATLSVSALDGATLLSPASIGAGMERVVFSVPAVTAGHTIQVYVYPDAGPSQSGLLVGGLQIEAGAFATSYVPTTSAAVTRAAESCRTTSLAPWFNHSAGTIQAEWDIFSGTVGGVFHFDGGGSGILAYAYDVNISNELYSASVSQAGIVLSDAAVRKKLAQAYELNRFAVTLNGGAVQTDSSVALPSGLTSLDLGRLNASAFCNGHYRRFSYMPYAVSDTLLKALST